MKILARIFVANLLVFGLGMYVLVSWIGEDLKPEYRKATEEPLVDSARILASAVAASSVAGKLDVTMLGRVFENVYDQRFSAEIYDYFKHGVDFRVYVTDTQGTVLFHSYDPGLVGEDFSQWRDVILTLRGEYGARTSQEDPKDPSSSVMYVSAPIVINGKIEGVLSVGKPTRAANLFVTRSRSMIRNGALVVGTVIVLVSLLLSGMITRPIQKLMNYAQAVRDGRRVELPELGGSEIGELGGAFDEMRDALEGKRYVERYVQSLTHEIKSPLAAIRGAVELLREDMTPKQREHFLDNIESEGGRLHAVVEKLLLLASLESRKALHDIEPLDLGDIVEDTLRGLGPLLQKKGLQTDFLSEGRARFDGDRFLVRQAVVNLVMNAVEFSPEGGSIELRVRRTPDDSIEFTVRDQGPGVPEYARERIFERFYSLKRPDTGRKSSGLGLALVREVAELHGGSIFIDNAPEGGTNASLSFPVEHRTASS
jgi:two-component system sensor histidine kinase CreC